MPHSIFFILVTIIFVLGIASPAFAHTAKVVGDFKIDVGWEVEPPLEGANNAIMITVTIAEESDKLLYDMVFFNKIHDSEDEITEKDLIGLTNTLEAYVSSNGSKTFLVIENLDDVGIYHAKLTPVAGPYTVYLFGAIKNLEFEASYKIENVKHNPDSLQTVRDLPAWVKNNAGWWAEGVIDDDSFIRGIEFMINNEIIKIPSITEHASSQNAASIPDWIKNNAKWWSAGNILDEDFIKGIQFLVEKGIIKM